MLKKKNELNYRFSYQIVKRIDMYGLIYGEIKLHKCQKYAMYKTANIF